MSRRLSASAAPHGIRRRGPARSILAATALLGLCASVSLAGAAVGATGQTATQQQSSTLPVKPPASATLEQCVTSIEQEGRTATFAGEMSAIPGSAKMEMRIDVLERTSEEPAFRNVAAPGLGVWRAAAPGVKVYKYLKQVTNLAAPAAYRGAVRFRWLNGKGKLLKASELRTPKCLQPLHPRAGGGTQTGEAGASATTSG